MREQRATHERFDHGRGKSFKGQPLFRSQQLKHDVILRIRANTSKGSSTITWVKWTYHLTSD